MKKRLEYNTKSEKRQLKNRPKMRVHGASLKRPNSHAGMAAVKAGKK